MATKSVKSIEITNVGGSWAITRNTDIVYLYTSTSITLGGAVSISIYDTPVANTEIVIDYRGQINPGLYSVVVFGRTLTASELMCNLKIFARYDGDTAAWVVSVVRDNAFHDAYKTDEIEVDTNGGTITVSRATRNKFINIVGSVSLAGNFSITYDGTPSDGETYYFWYRALVFLEGYSFTIFGRYLSQTEATCSNGMLIVAVYRESSAEWSIAIMLDSSITTQTFTMPYVYRAYVSQTGSADPAVDSPGERQNTVGAITLSRIVEGCYELQSSGLFPENKVFIPSEIKPLILTGPLRLGYMTMQWIDVNTIRIYTYTDDTMAVLSDGLLVNTPIEFYVYPYSGVLMSPSSSASSSVSPSTSVSSSVSSSPSRSPSSSASRSVSTSVSSSASSSVSSSASSSLSSSASSSVSPSTSISSSASSSPSASPSI